MDELTIEEIQKAFSEKMVGWSFHASGELHNEESGEINKNEYIENVIKGDFVHVKNYIDYLSQSPSIRIAVKDKLDRIITADIIKNTNKLIMEPYVVKTIYEFNPEVAFNRSMDRKAREWEYNGNIKEVQTIIPKVVKIVKLAKPNNCTGCTYLIIVNNKHICKKHEITNTDTMSIHMFKIEDPENTVCDLAEARKN